LLRISVKGGAQGQVLVYRKSKNNKLIFLHLCSTFLALFLLTQKGVATCNTLFVEMTSVHQPRQAFYHLNGANRSMFSSHHKNPNLKCQK
jgi:uncharacterized membrane protein (Fun14 family)